jgi:hypothetical protein
MQERYIEYLAALELLESSVMFAGFVIVMVVFIIGSLLSIIFSGNNYEAFEGIVVSFFVGLVLGLFGSMLWRGYKTPQINAEYMDVVKWMETTECERNSLHDDDDLY